MATLTVGGCSDSTEPDDGENGGNIEDLVLSVEVVAGGLSSPLFLTAPSGDSRLFVVERAGRVRIVEDRQLLGQPFLDISDRVGTGGEGGLLSIAFHPDYASNGYVFASYTDRNGDSRIERYTVTGNPNLADSNSGKLILTLEQPFSNHNGGLIVFGPDDKLYFGLGDGGGGGDPLGSGQDTGTLLGSMLRIDIDAADPYAIPPDNPFVGDAAGRDEIWAYGLRNPWRFSFDREAGVLYVADVGQNRWEEVNAVPADSPGVNYGWNIMEARHCFQPADGCDQSGLVLPVVEYDHDNGCSVTGGYVYRGSAIPELRGHYLYSDFCRGFLRSFRLSGGVVSDERAWDVGDLGGVFSFGEDAQGELYILSTNGRVYRLVAASE
ncbi:MAG: PQQ-dependent sugar dehydrogenase [Gemmatimonadota bacterium]|nr:MAG: PQQ-dependent sugar dehydrogenase [Gemmatimonadota bacterium]